MDIAIPLDPSSTTPLHVQLYEGLRNAIVIGRLSLGQRLPSTREISKSLGVARATASESYAQLLAEGYINTVDRSGTFVCSKLPESHIRIDNPRQAPTRPDAQRSASSWTPRERFHLSDYGNAVADCGSLVAETRISLGCPAFDNFPAADWARIMNRHFKNAERGLLDYSIDVLGYRPLREIISEWLKQARAVNCHPDRIIVTSGSQQALDLVARVFVNRGDECVVEHPVFLGIKQILTANGARLRPVPVDEDGLQTDKLPGKDEGIKLVYVTPSHQYPTGCVLSMERRRQLLDWARQSGAFILEDDYNTEFRYGARPLPSLQGMDESECVIYTGTFSKSLFPALRLGYLVPPEGLVDIMADAKVLSDRQSPLLEQYVLADFMREGLFEQHVRRMRALYEERHQTLLKSFREHFGDRVRIFGEDAGMHVLLQLDLGLSRDQILDRSADFSLELVSTNPFYIEEPPVVPEFLVGFTNYTPAEIKSAVEKLAKALV